MNPLAYLKSLGERFFRRSQIEHDLEDELRAHLRARANDLERLGLTKAEASRRARLEFGSPERYKTECREFIAGNWIDTLSQDVRFSFRMMRKSPGFTAIVILTMALGIGATTALFSIVDATLIHPLPYPQANELVRIEDDLPGVGARSVGMSEPEWQDLQHSGIFDCVSPAWYDDNNLTGSSQPARVSLLLVAPDYFAVLGIPPQLGRTFAPADHSPGILPEVVISDSLWKRTFGGAPDILGRNIRMDTDLYRIVGVMPPGFHDPGTAPRERNIEIWAPTSFYGAPLFDHPPRSGRNLPTAIARIGRGLTIQSAQSRVDALVASLRKQFPGDYPAQTSWQIRLVPLKDSVVGNVRRPLLLLLLAMGFVLIVGCVNIANLLLARASAREREMALREALGADRWRLARQLLTESLLLSALGGATGLSMVLLAKGFIVRLVPETIPRLNEISISWSILIFGMVASVVCGVVFGLAPALHAGGRDLTKALKQEGRGSSGSLRQARTRAVLVVTEFALSLVLLVAAGLLLRSFLDLVNARLGFDPERVITVQTRLPYPNVATNDVYSTAAQQTPFFRDILRRCGSLPGVEEIAIGDLGSLPLGHDRNNQNPPVPLILEGQQAQPNESPLVDESIVAPNYFHLMGMTLLRGRSFNEFDDAKSEPVAIINESMAQTYWPDGNPIGKHIKLSRRAVSWMTIIGIVANARTETLDNAAVPLAYSDLYQAGAKHLAIFLRGNIDPIAIPELVRKEIQSVDPTIPVFGARPLNETVAASLSQRRFSVEMIALFALAALVLAALGIYGVISYLVTERTHEIGIRVALGARHSIILRMILRQGFRLALAGAVIGLVCAAFVSRLMENLLYGIKPGDPLTFASVATLLIGVALFASYIPARRAMRVDPMVALRHE